MMNEKEIIRELKHLLERAVQLACEPEIGVIFSGGIDSTIIAVLAKNFSKVTAYSVGVENSRDLETVEKLREQADFIIKIKRFTEDEFKRTLPQVMRIMERKTNPLQVSCAVPIYFAAREAKKDGLKVVLSGQGGDELFGGYNRYLRQINDYQKLGKVLQKDVENAYLDNLKRDITICSANKLELRFPYMNSELADFSLGIPARLKIKEINDKEFSCIDEIDGKKFIRKYILRKAAKEIGIPSVVLNRPKKALQYGSGSWKLLRKIAREEGFKDVGLYLKSLNIS